MGSHNQQDCHSLHHHKSCQPGAAYGLTADAVSRETFDGCTATTQHNAVSSWVLKPPILTITCLEAQLTNKMLLHILRALNGIDLGAAYMTSSSDELLPEEGSADTAFLSP